MYNPISSSHLLIVTIYDYYEEDETDDNGILRVTLEVRFTKTVAVSSW